LFPLPPKQKTFPPYLSISWCPVECWEGSRDRWLVMPRPTWQERPARPYWRTCHSKWVASRRIYLWGVGNLFSIDSTPKEGGKVSHREGSPSSQDALKHIIEREAKVSHREGSPSSRDVLKHIIEINDATPNWRHGAF
jgi:hypothetical protein